MVHVTADTHSVSIGDRVTVGHGAIIHGATLEDGCLIGMGAQIRHGARVGARIAHRRRFPGRAGIATSRWASALGSPAKVRRPLNAGGARAGPQGCRVSTWNTLSTRAPTRPARACRSHPDAGSARLPSGRPAASHPRRGPAGRSPTLAGESAARAPRASCVSDVSFVPILRHVAHASAHPVASRTSRTSRTSRGACSRQTASAHIPCTSRTSRTSLTVPRPVPSVSCASCVAG